MGYGGLFILCHILIVYFIKEKLPDQIDLESSLLLTFSIFVTTVLTLGGQLQTPWLESISISFSGFNLMLFILALAVWYIGLQFKQQEMDLGHFSHGLLTLAIKTCLYLILQRPRGLRMKKLLIIQINRGGLCHEFPI